MFSTRKLISTPPRANGNGGRHEFTPIGNRSKSVDSRPKNAPINLETATSSRTLFKPMTGNDINNSMLDDNTFDYTVDNFEEDATNGALKNGTDTFHTTRPNGIAVNGRTHNTRSDFISNGSSIKEQEDRIRQLDAENYRLKLNVASMQRLLSDTPEDHRVLLSQNISLKADLDKVIQRLKELENENSKFERDAERDNSSAISSKEYEKHIKQLEADIKGIIEVKDIQIGELEAQVNRYKNLEDDLENYKHSEEQLYHYKQELGSKDDLYRQMEERYRQQLQLKDDQINQHKQKSDQLHSRLSEDSETQALKSEIFTLKDTISKYVEIIENLENEVHSHRDNSESLKFQNNELIEKVANIQSKLSSVTSELEYAKDSNASLRKRESQLYGKDDEVKHWQDRHSSLQEMHSGLKDSHSSLEQKVISLQERISSLQNTNDKLTSAHRKEITKYQQDVHALTMKLDQVKYTNSTQRDEQVETLKSQLFEKSQEVSQAKEDQARTLTKLQTEIGSLEEEISQKNEIINRLTNDKRSTSSANYAFESQIESMKSRNNRFVDEIQELHGTIEELRADLRKANADSRVSSSSRESDDLRHQLSDSNATAAQYKSQLADNEFVINELKSEIKFLNREILKKSSASTDSGTNTLLDIANDSRTRLEGINENLERERTNLIQQVRESEQQLSSLQSLLSINSPLGIVPEVKDLLSANLELKELLERYASRIEEMDIRYSSSLNGAESSQHEYRRLQTKVRILESELTEKEKIIRRLETTSSSDSSYDEFASILQAKSNDEIRIKKLQFELENVKRQHELESNQLEEKIRSLEMQYDLQKEILRSNKKNASSRVDDDSSAIRSLLEVQLREATKLSDELSKSLSDSNEMSTLVENKVQRLEMQNNELLKVTSNLENSSTLQKRAMEKKIKELTSDLIKATGYCQKLADRVNQLTSDHVITEKLDKLNLLENDQINRIKTENTQLQSKVNSLQKKLNGAGPTSENSLLQNQVIYLRGKLRDFNLKCNDLEMIYNFTISCIKNSNQTLQDDINRLVDCGVYPDYTLLKLQKIQRGTPMTFKVLAKFVLASVRIRRRFERSERRTIRLLNLKSEIEVEKAKLMK